MGKSIGTTIQEETWEEPTFVAPSRIVAVFANLKGDFSVQLWTDSLSERGRRGDLHLSLSFFFQQDAYCGEEEEEEERPSFMPPPAPPVGSFPPMRGTAGHNRLDMTLAHDTLELARRHEAWGYGFPGVCVLDRYLAHPEEWAGIAAAGCPDGQVLAGSILGWLSHACVDIAYQG